MTLTQLKMTLRYRRVPPLTPEEEQDIVLAFQMARIRSALSEARDTALGVAKPTTRRRPVARVMRLYPSSDREAVTAALGWGPIS